MLQVALTPMESGEWISQRSGAVRVDIPRCHQLARQIMDSIQDGTIGDIEYKASPLHPEGLSDEQHLNWVFVIDTLNFSFWPNDNEEYYVDYRGNREVGYLAMCAAFMKAYEGDIPICDAGWMETVTEEDLGKILVSGSGHAIPMLHQRARALNESGKWLKDRYNGQMMGVVRACGTSAQSLLRTILTIESFRDQTSFRGANVWLLNRAQVLVADVYSVLKGSSTQEFRYLVNYIDIDTITMFADYRVPQALCHLGIMHYSPQLRLRLDNGEVMPFADDMEIEIRGCSIYAVNEIFKAVIRMRLNDYMGVNWYTAHRPIFAIDIHAWLLQYRREHAQAVDAAVPFHRCRQIYY
ncbi:hypothetical protein PENTCL1PPCAC_19200 [Pristionchus entomophagus]|uniref:Queuosine 5'-phosphate N-glycosylase/hydrolase n=1 Tax=Pristionchus entomophagus TaxID=358040 RepID=A0AAV5TRB8_9BILA|nr:hypothetical protein PENTCL1PPCAC_19200 [Pristionchus entomophagus]